MLIVYACHLFILHQYGRIGAKEPAYKTLFAFFRIPDRFRTAPVSCFEILSSSALFNYKGDVNILP
jgi:hypothetical protein